MRSINFNTLTTKQWLVISIIFSILLSLIRVIATGENTYLFLIWNLFLGVIPYAISEWLSQRIDIIEKRYRFIAVLIVWLLFIPNAFYIVTDLFHLDQFDSAPKWFDLLLIFSFAWNGMLLGIMSISGIEMILDITTGRRFSMAIIFAVMWLNAFGIYIGRYLRYNSWDVITKPFTLFNELAYVLVHPLRNKMEWSMITVYAVFLTVIYFTLRKPGDSSGSRSKVQRSRFSGSLKL